MASTARTALVTYRSGTVAAAATAAVEVAVVVAVAVVEGVAIRRLSSPMALWTLLHGVHRFASLWRVTCSFDERIISERVRFRARPSAHGPRTVSLSVPP